MNDFRMPRKEDRERKRGKVPPAARNTIRTPWTANGAKVDAQPPVTAAELLEMLERATGTSDEFKLLAIRAVLMSQKAGAKPSAGLSGLRLGGRPQVA